MHARDSRGNGFLVEEKSEAVEANLPHGCSKAPNCLCGSDSFVGHLEGEGGRKRRTGSRERAAVLLVNLISASVLYQVCK